MVDSREEALWTLQKALDVLGVKVIGLEDVNQKRDYLLNTNHGRIYLKFARDWKYKDAYAKEGEPHTIYATINQDVLSQYDFQSLVICHSNGHLYTITRERVKEVAKFGINPNQGEAVAHIPIRELKRVITSNI